MRNRTVRASLGLDACAAAAGAANVLTALASELGLESRGNVAADRESTNAFRSSRDKEARVPVHVRAGTLDLSMAPN